MPWALVLEGLKTPSSSAPEFAIGYNGTLAQTTIVDAWNVWKSGSTVINASTNNSSSGNNGTNTEGAGNAERKLSPNDGKHTGHAKGDISADPFWNNQEKG